MRYVYAEIRVKGKEQRSIKTLVDAGATYLVLYPKTINELDLSIRKIGYTIIKLKRSYTSLYNRIPVIDEQTRSKYSNYDIDYNICIRVFDPCTVNYARY